MTPSRFKTLGWVLVLLAIVGTITSWTAMQIADVRTGYIVANILLLLAGTTSLLLGSRRSRTRAAERAQVDSE